MKVVPRQRRQVHRIQRVTGQRHGEASLWDIDRLDAGAGRHERMKGSSYEVEHSNEQTRAPSASTVQNDSFLHDECSAA